VPISAGGYQKPEQEWSRI